MSIAVIITDRNTDALCQSLKAQLPEVSIQQWPNIHAPDAVELAVLWNHPKGITNELPNLKAVVSMGAGVDHIDNDDCIASHVSRDRIVTLALQQNMAQYVLQHILAEHRHAAAYCKQQAVKHWQVLEADESMPVVGFLGLGSLGTFVADRCGDLGFEILAWTLHQKHPEHTCYHGKSGLKFVCENSDYLVVLLPLNENTHHIIDTQVLSWCRSNLMLINVGRGAHVDDEALLNALDNGQIRKAILDVFQTEPLPSTHPYWSHPKVTLTPHSSSRSDVAQTAQQIVEKYRRLADKG